MKQEYNATVSIAQLYARYQIHISALTGLKCSVTQLCNVASDEKTVKTSYFCNTLKLITCTGCWLLLYYMSFMSLHL